MFQKDVSIRSAPQGLLDLGIIFFGVVLLFGCSQVSIPLQPVPMTLQTVGVLLVAFTYADKKAIQTMLAYVLLGALGAPVFSGYKGGLPVILGPTGGYILGFIIVTLLATPFKKFIAFYDSIVKAFILSVAGTLVIMVCGVFWLSLHIGLTKAIAVGFMPFIIPGLIKSAMLSLILRSIGYFSPGRLS